MTRRAAIAAAVVVVALASGVGGWLLLMGRSPFGRAATSTAAAAAQTASSTAPGASGGARLLWTLAGHTASPASLAVSRDGTRAISGGGHGASGHSTTMTNRFALNLSGVVMRSVAVGPPTCTA